MSIHELKLDTKYFNKVKNGSKNFEIRKNDRDFQVGDILELKAFQNGYYAWEDYPLERKIKVWFDGCPKEKADTIIAEITSIISAEDWNSEDIGTPTFCLNEDGKLEFSKLFYVGETIVDLFGSDTLTDDYVILGIEIIKEADDENRK